MKKQEAKLLLRRSYRILALSLILLVLTVVILWRQPWKHSSIPEQEQTAKKVTVYADEPVSLKNGKSPAEFPLIEVKAGTATQFTVQGTCQDIYYTVLLYASDRDYRDDPTANVFNQAFACNKGQKFNQEITLPVGRLIPGVYYLLQADQGAEDSWYNPH